MKSVTTEYMRAREALIEEDRALRVDTARLRSLSNLEARAEAVVRTIRTAEATAIWGAEKSILEYDPVDDTPNVFPGMAFLTGELQLLEGIDVAHIEPKHVKPSLRPSSSDY